MNFKRVLSFIMTVFLILSVFSSCKGKAKPTLSEKPGDIEETKIVFSETIEKTETTGLYELGKEITKDTENIKIVAGNETAHLCIKGESSLEVIHFSVFDNKVLATTNIPGTEWNYGVLEKDSFYAVELSSATLFLFDRKGEKKSETKLDEASLSFAFLQKTGENIVYKKTDSSNLYKLNLTTKEKTQTKESFEISGNPSCDENAVYVKDSLGRSYSVAFKDMAVTKTKTEPFREYVGPLGIAVENNYFTVTQLNTGEQKIMIERLNKDEKIICAQDLRFITINTENQKYFRYYDFSQGIASQEMGKDEEKLLDAQFVSEDYIFSVVRNTTSSKNIYRLLKISEDTTMTGILSDKIFEKALYSNVLGGETTEDTTQTDKIAEEHGVRFLYGKMGSAFKTDFTYSQADSKEVLEKLTMAERVFNVLPKDFLMEVTNNREIWVYLCKNLDNKGTEYTKFSGQTELYNHKLIFIDISCDDEIFTELLCHEFAHILDDYMSESVLTGFGDITPENIKKAAYTNSYTKELTDKYTQKDSEKGDIWFYNKYCKISEKEDRVITLGEMFNVILVSIPSEEIKEENVKKKASFMAKALEESFDFCKKGYTQPWEMYIMN